MIDQVKKVIETLLNKDAQGNLTPTEFNLFAEQVQNKIFRGYFEDLNIDKNRENRGLTNPGYANLAFNERQRIAQFSAEYTIGQSSVIASTSEVVPVPTDPVPAGRYALPSDMYFIEQSGVTVFLTGNVIDETERSKLAYLKKSIAAPDASFPVYERFPNYVQVYPDTLGDINIKYVRQPKAPKWTYFEFQGNEMYNPSATDFQDFELHESEFSNIVIEMAALFSINLRENDVMNILEQMKAKEEAKESN